MQTKNLVYLHLQYQHIAHNISTKNIKNIFQQKFSLQQNFCFIKERKWFSLWYEKYIRCSVCARNTVRDGWECFCFIKKIYSIAFRNHKTLHYYFVKVKCIEIWGTDGILLFAGNENIAIDEMRDEVSLTLKGVRIIYFVF